MYSPYEDWVVQDNSQGDAVNGNQAVSIYNPAFNLVVDVYGNSYSAGAPIDAWPANGQFNQAFWGQTVSHGARKADLDSTLRLGPGRHLVLELAQGRHERQRDRVGWVVGTAIASFCQLRCPPRVPVGHGGYHHVVDIVEELPPRA